MLVFGRTCFFLGHAPSEAPIKSARFLLAWAAFWGFLIVMLTCLPCYFAEAEWPSLEVATSWTSVLRNVRPGLFQDSAGSLPEVGFLDLRQIIWTWKSRGRAVNFAHIKCSHVCTAVKDFCSTLYQLQPFMNTLVHVSGHFFIAGVVSYV